MNYIIEVSICWLVFYLLYVLLLSKETFFNINRLYLLGTLVAGLLIPLLNLTTSIPMIDEELVFYLDPITIGVQSFETTLEEIVITSHQQTSNYAFLWPLIYGIGVAILSIRLFYGIWQVVRLRRDGQFSKKDGYHLVETQSAHLPFSFFNTLYISKTINLENQDQEKILAHELAHIQGRHSYDVFFVEILSILMWCSPLIFLYNRSIRNIHEYLADERVLQTTQKKQYGQLLLKQLQSGFTIALANNFNHSQLKKRFNMMMKNKSNRSALLKYLPLLPLALVLLLAFAMNDNARFQEWPTLKAQLNAEAFNPEKIEQDIRTWLQIYQTTSIGDMERNNAFQKLAKLPKTYPEQREEVVEIMEKVIKELELPLTISSNTENTFCLHSGPTDPTLMSNGDPILQVADQMPYFPGCEQTSDAKADKNCADKKMLNFVYKNIIYPEDARENGIEGLVLVRFVIDKNGEVVNPEIKRSLGYGCDETVLEVISQMPKWVPGVHEGKTVNVYFNLPVRFKLEGAAKKSSKAKNQTSIPSDVDEMPHFKGCEGIVDKTERKKCAQKALLNFIYSNIKYPKAAIEKDIEGTVVTQFVVDKTGAVQDAKITRSIGGGCDEEVLRVLNDTEWVPGKHQGEIVKVKMTIPVKFKLDGSKSKKQSPQLILEQFDAFPNPSSGQINLRFQSPKGNTTVEVYDLSGKSVFNTTFESDGAFEQKIDLTGLAKGAVFIKVTQDGKVFTEKVMYQ